MPKLAKFMGAGRQIGAKGLVRCASCGLAYASPRSYSRGIMPIAYQIDHERRRVVATAQGRLSGGDMFGYQNEVWSRPDVAGYDEIIESGHGG